jgi:hypothetical protein
VGRIFGRTKEDGGLMPSVVNDEALLHIIYKQVTDMGSKWQLTRDEIKEVVLQMTIADGWLNADKYKEAADKAFDTAEEDTARRYFG